MMIFSSYSRECDKHNVYVFGFLSERVSERRSRKRDTDIGLDLHINVIGRMLFIELEFTLYSKKNWQVVWYINIIKFITKVSSDDRFKRLQIWLSPCYTFKCLGPLFC